MQSPPLLLLSYRCTIVIDFSRYSFGIDCKHDAIALSLQALAITLPLSSDVYLFVCRILTFVLLQRQRWRLQMSIHCCYFKPSVWRFVYPYIYIGCILNRFVFALVYHKMFCHLLIAREKIHFDLFDAYCMLSIL